MTVVRLWSHGAWVVTVGEPNEAVNVMEKTWGHGEHGVVTGGELTALKKPLSHDAQVLVMVGAQTAGVTVKASHGEQVTVTVLWEGRGNGDG